MGKSSRNVIFKYICSNKLLQHCMKLKLLLLTCSFNSLFAITPSDIKVIHKDPMDIRKTSIRGGAHTTLPYSSGMYFCLNQYIKPRTMLYANWQLFTEYTKSYVYDPTYDSDKSPNVFHIRTFGIERHIVDKEVPDFISVNITSRVPSGNNDQYVKVPANKRHVLAFTSGIMVMNGRQLYFRDGDYNTKNNYLTKVNTGKKVNIADETLDSYAKDIYTRTSVTSLELGLKMKRFEAVGLFPAGYGRRWTDIYREYYLTLILPVYGRGDELVYLNNKTSDAYKITNLKTPVPGVKLGLNFRNCISSGLDLGAEAGFLPSVIGGNVLFMSAHLGICINAGKLKLIDEAYEAPKLR